MQDWQNAHTRAVCDSVAHSIAALMALTASVNDGKEHKASEFLQDPNKKAAPKPPPINRDGFEMMKTFFTKGSKRDGISS